MDDAALYKSSRQETSETPRTFDDYEANELTYERPPSQVESFYSQYHAQPEQALSQGKNNFEGNGELGLNVREMKVRSLD